MEYLYLCLLILSYLSFSVDANDSFVYPCKTPNAEIAACISIFSCPILMKSLGTLQPTAIEFIRKSICCDYSPGDLKVCCGNRGNFLGSPDVSVAASPPSTYLPPTSTETEPRFQLTSALPLSTSIDSATEATSKLYTSVWNNSTQEPIVTTRPIRGTNQKEAYKESSQVPIVTEASMVANPKETYRKYVKEKLLPKKSYCGLQHTDDRFYTDNITALDEFPWLVHVIFLDDEDEDPTQYLDRCNGVLINNRYVLTIGTCANQAPAVRLGQHNVNKTISCIQNPDFPECTEPKYDVLVEEEIHRSTDVVQHDFALLRLAEKVQFSDFVRPICLPLPEYKRPDKTDSLIFSGWGAVTQEIAAIKKRLTYNLTNGIDECLKLDDSGLKDFTANNSLMCLTPGENNTELACSGDIGGPLMYSYRNQWFAEGLLTNVYDWFQEQKVTGVSKKNVTTDFCSKTLPISGVKITSEILDWIMDNIKP